ncbi:MAG: decaprenylphospho-beta-D-erythro-pentofuranosid-2-ulose 2-reductase [Acidimicrobiia bacterium]
MNNALGAVQSVLVLGATSEIAQATVRQLAARRARTIVLAARNPESLETEMKELERLGATNVSAVAFDATASAHHEAFIQEVFESVGDIDLVLLAFGVLGDQDLAEHDSQATRDIIETNFVGAASVAVPIAQRLVEQGHGTFVVLSSVAGERARRSNFVYGSSKAGLDAFFQGLGDSLVGTGARVMIVRPGFVHSKMTAGMEPAPLATTPDAVATAICRGIQLNKEIVWVPGTLRYVMSILRHVPRVIFRRLPL